MHGFVDSKYQIGHSNIRYTNPTTSMPSQMTNMPSKIPHLFDSVICCKSTYFLGYNFKASKWQTKMTNIRCGKQRAAPRGDDEWRKLKLPPLVNLQLLFNRSQRWKTFCFHSCQPDIEISKKKLTTSLITFVCINQPKVPKSCQDK